MSSIRVFTISPALIALCLTFSAFAQDNNSAGNEGNSQVEVKTDRYSGNTTVRMKPQLLIDRPDLKLTLEMRYELKKKEVAEASVLLEEVASMRFESAIKGPFKWGDRQLHFIVDGKQLSIGDTSSRLADRLLAQQDEKGRWPDFIFHAALFISQVEELARGRTIEMRLGTVELTLSPSTLKAIREWAREFANYAPTRSKPKQKG